MTAPSETSSVSRREIALTQAQAEALVALDRARQAADHDFAVYCSAILGGTDLVRARLVGIEPAADGKPARLVVDVTPSVRQT